MAGSEDGKKHQKKNECKEEGEERKMFNFTTSLTWAANVELKPIHNKRGELTGRGQENSVRHIKNFQSYD